MTDTTDQPPATPHRRTSSALKLALSALSSLRLTVFLLGASMVVVFLATIDQVHLGIHEVIDIYFHRFIAYYDLRKGGGFDESVGAILPPTPFFRIWLPGGYTLGTLLLVNLIAAHTVRFKMSWRKSGIFLIHAGIVLLLIGELFTGLLARESQMTLDEGQTLNFSEDPLEAELAFVDVSNPGLERHIAIPESRLRPGAVIAHPELPFRVEVVDFHANARLRTKEGPAGEGWLDVPANQDLGPRVQWFPMAPARTLDDVSLPAVVVRLRDGGRDFGSWLASRQIPVSQAFTTSDGRSWRLALRGRRSYKDFSITLNEFQHERYPGTNIPKDFSSFITLTSPEDRKGRDIRIWMNHPLRHEGYTFYQHQFANDDTTSILLVVNNPSWLIPYISCVAVFLGLGVQFGIGLFSHLGRRRKKAAAAVT